MTRRESRLAFRGTVAHRPDASSLLSGPGSAVLIRRGVDRSIAISCPDGCGEVLTINLDPRTGPAWRFYDDAGAVSLYPSVWRRAGCRSHFIVWRSRIYWCDWDDELEGPGKAAIARARAILDANYRPYSDIATKLGVVPWEALAACCALVRDGEAERRFGEEGLEFRRSGLV